MPKQQAHHDDPKTGTPIVLAASGSGRSLENFLKAQEEAKFRFKIVGVISSSASCRAAKIAKHRDIPLHIESFSSGSLSPSDQLLSWLEGFTPQVQWIVLAGFLKVFPTKFPSHFKWAQQMINIHPALLPAYGGKNMYGNYVHSAVLADHQSTTGASVHFINDQYDKGRIISQIKVPVLDSDSQEELSRRVFNAECKLYPQTLADLIAGHLPLNDNQIKFYN